MGEKAKYGQFSMELHPQGLYVEVGYQRFVIGYYERPALQYDVAVRWCRDQGGWLPTLEQALVLCEYRDKLSSVLKEAGYKPIWEEHMWTRRLHPVFPDQLYTVRMYNGMIVHARRDWYNAARPIITLTGKTSFV